MNKQRAVELLWDWQNGGTSFTCMLYSLIAKADGHNKILLYSSFPVEVETYCEWFNSFSDTQFFEAYGIIEKQ